MSSKLFDFNALSAVNVRSGHYAIGSDMVPNASPAHAVSLTEYWIDSAPLSFAHFERFVVGGGYFEPSLWVDSQFAGREILTNGSVDSHCDYLYSLSRRVESQLCISPVSSFELPLVGLTWMEAAAVCRYFGARLPFEREWEVAMQPGPTVRNPELPDPWKLLRSSAWGCKVTMGVLQEWTADAFDSHYWRGDLHGKGNVFRSTEGNMGVAVRGSSPFEIHQDIRFRQSADSDQRHEFRGFRRAWDHLPDDRVTTISFGVF